MSGGPQTTSGHGRIGFMVARAGHELGRASCGGNGQVAGLQWLKTDGDTAANGGPTRRPRSSVPDGPSQEAERRWLRRSPPSRSATTPCLAGRRRAPAGGVADRSGVTSSPAAAFGDLLLGLHFDRQPIEVLVQHPERRAGALGPVVLLLLGEQCDTGCVGSRGKCEDGGRSNQCPTNADAASETTAPSPLLPEASTRHCVWNCIDR